MEGIDSMVLVKLIREEERKTTCETLNVVQGEWQGVGIDRIVVSGACPEHPNAGFALTNEDFEFIYNKKRREREIEQEKKLQEEQAEKETKADANKECKERKDKKKNFFGVFKK